MTYRDIVMMAVGVAVGFPAGRTILRWQIKASKAGAKISSQARRAANWTAAGAGVAAVVVAAGAALLDTWGLL